MADDANTDSLAQAVPAESVTDLHEVTDTVHDKSIKGPNGTVPDESEGVDQVATDAPANCMFLACVIKCSTVLLHSHSSANSFCFSR